MEQTILKERLHPRRLLRSRKGSILLHVLVSSVVVIIISMGLLTFLMLQYKMTDRAAKSSQFKKQDEQAFFGLLSYWNENWSGAGVPPDFDGYTCAAGGTECSTACPGITWAATCTKTGSPTACVETAGAAGAPRKLCIVSAAFP